MEYMNKSENDDKYLHSLSLISNKSWKNNGNILFAVQTVTTD